MKRGEERWEEGEVKGKREQAGRRLEEVVKVARSESSGVVTRLLVTPQASLAA